MAQKKQPKIIKESNPAAKTEVTVKETEKSQAGDSIAAFYLRSVLLSVVFFTVCWMVIVNNYFDMAEWDGLLRRNQAKQVLNNEETKKLMFGDKYRKSADFKWFYNYKWIYHNLLLKNLKLQASLDTAGMDYRQLYKNKADFKFVQMIRDNTPENAVILMPDQADMVIPKNFPAETPQFTMLTDKAWCYYFLYPRKLVHEEADSKDTLYNKPNYRKDPKYAENRSKVTHVAIVYGNGYEHLEYKPERLEAYTVLPIRQSK